MNETITIDGQEYEVLPLYRIGEITHAKTGSGAILTARSIDGYHHVYSECENWDAVTTFCDEEFEIFGIQPLKLIPKKPVEFDGMVTDTIMGAKLVRVPDDVPLGTKFRCTQIMEEGE